MIRNAKNTCTNMHKTTNNISNEYPPTKISNANAKIKSPKPNQSLYLYLEVDES